MKKLLICLFALLSAQAFGQGYSSTVLQNSPGNYGRPVPYPQVLVCVSSDNNVPCISRAATYSDDTLNTQCAQTGSSGQLIGNPTSGANCNNPGIGDVNGNFTIYVAGGEYTICTYSGTWLCQKQTIGNSSSGGTGNIIPCSISGCDTFYPLANTPSVAGDSQTNDDGSGNKKAKSYLFTDPNHSGNWFESKGPALPPLSASSSVYFSINPNFPGSTYGFEPWDTEPTPGDCLEALAGDGTGADAGKWVKLGDAGAPCGQGGGGGLPTTQMANPSAPTLTNQNAAGARSITYLVQALEDINGVYHTANSATATIANANASPQVLLSAYGDTLYGARCFDVYVTADSGGRTLGLVGHCVDKKWIDIGAAGGGIAATNTNTTILTINMSPNPGCNIPPNGIIGIDAPPCSPTAFDNELGPTFGAPGDSQNPFFSWGGGGTNPCTQGAATAQWSGGTIIFTTDSTSNLNCLEEALPVSAPYTFEAFVDLTANTTSNSGVECLIGFRESSTGKVLTIGDDFAVTPSGSINVGNAIVVDNWTSNSAHSHVNFFPGDMSGYYLKIQNTGSNIIATFSHVGNGIGFGQISSQTITTPFTTGPNQLIIGGSGLGSGTAVCTFDFVRRTQ